MRGQQVYKRDAKFFTHFTLESNLIETGTGWYITPTSVKGVVFKQEEVLLCLNHRNEWELPGGWPDPSDKSLQETLVREVKEETTLDVVVGELIFCELYTPVAGESVAIIVFAAEVQGSASPSASFEHSTVRFVDPNKIPINTSDAYRKAIYLASSSRKVKPWI